MVRRVPLVLWLPLSCLSMSCSRKDAPFGKPASCFFQDRQVLTLCSAILASDARAMEEAIDGGANLNLKGRDGITPLLWTLGTGNREAFERLLVAGADPNIQMEDGRSVMSYSASMDDCAYLRLTLAHGGTPNLVNPVTGRSLLLETMFHHQLDNMKALVESGANIDHPSRTGTPPIIDACYLNRYDMVHYLLLKGADHKAQTTDGDSVMRCLRDDLKNPHLLRTGERFQAKAKVIDLLGSNGVDVVELRQLYRTPTR